MNYNNMAYSVKRKYKGTTYYSCNKNKLNKCPARLIVKHDGIVIEKNEHTCITDNVNRAIDVREDMKTYLENECIKDISVLPITVWERATEEMNRIYENHPIITLTKNYAINHIKYIRRQIHGANSYREIEQIPICNVSDTDERKYLQFNIYYSSQNLGRRIIGFGHPDLICLLRYPSISLFIDGTFKVTPANFQQCLIVMMYDHSIDLYLPIFYILLDSKDELSYSNALHWIKIQCGFQIKPGAITCDFEKALLNAIVNQFNNTSIIGCLFHFKQALRRKLISLRIDKEQIHQVMKIGNLDLLTVIPTNEIIKYGIPYIRANINEGDDVSKWNQFWLYFRKTWMTTFPANYWNINHAISENLNVVNRTNNALEVYNRIFTSKFKNGRPSLLMFTNICKQESIRYVNLISDIKKGLARPPPHNLVKYPTLPDNYLHFKTNIA